MFKLPRRAQECNTLVMDPTVAEDTYRVYSNAMLGSIRDTLGYVLEKRTYLPYATPLEGVCVWAFVEGTCGMLRLEGMSGVSVRTNKERGGNDKLTPGHYYKMTRLVPPVTRSMSAARLASGVPVYKGTAVGSTAGGGRMADTEAFGGGVGAERDGRCGCDQ
ncbi:hypothetical protein BD779DRAFT_1471657 [Infundibulicybe gibba]|nr:hypothetical protein BD779DRAFT_1471657 [Infundibulicybe gibba]